MAGPHNTQSRRDQTSWIRRSASPFRAAEVRLCGVTYSPHRHDTYTFAVTQAGVQSFHYRRALRHSLPGQLVVLHPDEVHDGLAGAEEGFAYRSITIAPELVRSILGGSPLPHLPGGVSTDPVMIRAASALCDEIDTPLSALERSAALEALIARFHTLVGAPIGKRRHPDIAAAQRAREFIEDQLLTPLTIDQIAEAADKDRWELSRAFKHAFGTSPYRYITMRRLETALTRMAQGAALSEAALDAQFFDQSHFTRHFKNAFGLPPAQWLRLTQPN